jgi:hypothetical protein
MPPGITSLPARRPRESCPLKHDGAQARGFEPLEEERKGVIEMVVDSLGSFLALLLILLMVYSPLLLPICSVAFCVTANFACIRLATNKQLGRFWIPALICLLSTSFVFGLACIERDVFVLIPSLASSEQLAAKPSSMAFIILLCATALGAGFIVWIWRKAKKTRDGR